MAPDRWETLDGLYSGLRGRLVRTARRLLSDQAAAEDAVQEAWVKALDRYGPTPPSDSMPSPAWFYRVTVNLCYDRLRAAGRIQPVAQEAGPDGLAAVATHDGAASDAADPEKAVLRQEAAEAVRAAVDALPPALREVILLREWAELKYRDIAQAVGCPVGTVMSRLHLARKRLRVTLEPYLDLETQARPREDDGCEVVG